MMDELRHKHWALIAIGALIVAFLILLAWAVFRGEPLPVPSAPVATSTLPVDAPLRSEPVHIRDTGTYYDIDLTYPSATPLQSLSESANAAAVNTMRAGMEQVAAEFKKNGNYAGISREDAAIWGVDKRKAVLSSKYTSYSGERTVSYVFEIYEDTLGAHPNLYFRTFTFDTTTGKQVMLGDLFDPSVRYLERLSGKARSDLPHSIRERSGSDPDMEYLTRGTAPTAENFQHFYIEGAKLVVIFPPYQVGPYVLGTQVLSIPLPQLSDVLRNDYLP
jgi:hypothetical protein